MCQLQEQQKKSIQLVEDYELGCKPKPSGLDMGIHFTSATLQELIFIDTAHYPPYDGTIVEIMEKKQRRNQQELNRPMAKLVSRVSERAWDTRAYGAERGHGL